MNAFKGNFILRWLRSNDQGRWVVLNQMISGKLIISVLIAVRSSSDIWDGKQNRTGRPFVILTIYWILFKSKSRSTDRLLEKKLNNEPSTQNCGHLFPVYQHKRPSPIFPFKNFLENHPLRWNNFIKFP